MSESDQARIDMLFVKKCDSMIQSLTEYIVPANVLRILSQQHPDFNHIDYAHNSKGMLFVHDMFVR